MNLAKKLEETPHREVAGSDSFAAFEFQLMFGVEILFENYDKLEDYAVLFEFHDDITLLTGTQEPKGIEFFQLKHTTNGNWTLARLVHRKKKKDSSSKEQSIIQKLYSNIHAFEGYTQKAQVVSNTYLSEFCQAQCNLLRNLPEEGRTRIIDHIQEIYPSANDQCLDILGFRRTELDKASCYELVKGRVHSFLQQKIGGDAFQLQACTDSIVTQCRIRNKKLATDLSGPVTEIVAQKGITRSDLRDWLHSIAASKLAPEWTTIQPHIISGWTFAELNEIRIAYERYRVVALDSSNDAQNSVLRLIRKVLQGQAVSSPLCQFIDLAVASQRLELLGADVGFEKTYLKAMVLYEVFKSQQAGPIQEIDTQPAKEAK